MRICNVCGRPRTDEYHTLVPRVGPTGEALPPLPPRLAGWYEGHPVWADAEPRPRMRYTCHLTAVATDPDTGELEEIEMPKQRIKSLDNRWVQTDRLSDERT